MISAALRITRHPSSVFVMMGIAVFLAIIESFQAHLRFDLFGGASEDSLLAHHLRLFTSVEQFLPQHHAPFYWSACLMVKDENILLPEWLAYHWEVLPLRRIIIARDPMAKTDPRHILREYEKHNVPLNWTLWEYDDYFFEGRISTEKYNYTHLWNATGMYSSIDDAEIQRYHKLWRQQSFYTTCLRHLKKEEGRSWTMVVDPDEYVMWNSYSPNEGTPYSCLYQERPGWKRKRCTRIFHDPENHKNDSTMRIRQNLPVVGGRWWVDHPSDNWTVAHYMNRNETMETLIRDLDFRYGRPCHVLPRIQIPSFESELPLKDEIADDNEKDNDTDGRLKIVPTGFDLKNFDTLRFREHGQMQTLLQGKSIVDVRRFSGKVVQNPHRVCPQDDSKGTGSPHPIISSFLRVQHYSGSLQVFLARGKALYQFLDRSIDKSEVLGTTTESVWWLQSFVRHVGYHRAKYLTEGLREWAFKDYADAYGTFPIPDDLSKRNLSTV